MSTFSPAAARVALAIGYWDPEDVFEWVQTLVTAHPGSDSQSALLELLRQPTRVQRGVVPIESLLEDIVATASPLFYIRTKSSEQLARTIFKTRLEEYLAGHCGPWDVCRMIAPIESLYDFPDWLGDMYNACDWVNPDDVPADCRNLEQAIRRYLHGT